MIATVRSKHWFSKKLQGFGIIIKTDTIPMSANKIYAVFELRLFYYSAWIIFEEHK